MGQQVDDDLLDEDGNSSAGGDQHLFGGVWTRIKLEALEKYLGAFNTALSKQRFTRIYVDAFAGTGRCDIKVNGEKTSIDGSARRALAASPGFHKYCFIELLPRKLVALKSLAEEHPGKTIEIIQSDANTALKSLCTQYQWRNERAVLFLDPFGMHVEWTTLEAIAKTGAIDVWYLFPYAGLYRQAANNADALDADKEASLTRVLGTDEWRQAFYVQKRQTDLFGGDDGDERSADHREMLDFVSKRIKGLFAAVTAPKRWTTGGSDARVSHGHERPPACAPAKKLAQVLRELRAEESRTGRLQDAGRPRRGTCRSAPYPAWCRGTRK